MLCVNLKILHMSGLSTYKHLSECIQTAAALADRMDLKADPCDDFYQLACGGYVKKVG